MDKRQIELTAKLCTLSGDAEKAFNTIEHALTDMAYIDFELKHGRPPNDDEQGEICEKQSENNHLEWLSDKITAYYEKYTAIANDATKKETVEIDAEAQRIHWGGDIARTQRYKDEIMESLFTSELARNIGGMSKSEYPRLREIGEELAAEFAPKILTSIKSADKNGR